MKNTLVLLIMTLSSIAFAQGFVERDFDVVELDLAYGISVSGKTGSIGVINCNSIEATTLVDASLSGGGAVESVIVSQDLIVIKYEEMNRILKIYKERGSDKCSFTSK